MRELLLRSEKVSLAASSKPVLQALVQASRKRKFPALEGQTRPPHVWLNTPITAQLSLTLNLVSLQIHHHFRRMGRMRNGRTMRLLV